MSVVESLYNISGISEELEEKTIYGLFYSTEDGREAQILRFGSREAAEKAAEQYNAKEKNNGSYFVREYSAMIEA